MSRGELSWGEIFQFSSGAIVLEPKSSHLDLKDLSSLSNKFLMSPCKIYKVSFLNFHNLALLASWTSLEMQRQLWSWGLVSLKWKSQIYLKTFSEFVIPRREQVRLLCRLQKYSKKFRGDDYVKDCNLSFCVISNEVRAQIAVFLLPFFSLIMRVLILSWRYSLVMPLKSSVFYDFTMYVVYFYALIFLF